MSDIKHQRMQEILRDLAAEFLQRHSNHLSLITVTGIEVTDDEKRAKIFISVLPENKENAAVNFAQRQREDFREFLKKKSRFRTLPRVDFVLDLGEKNRQRIDELLFKARIEETPKPRKTPKK